MPQYVGSTDLLRVDLLTLKNDAYRATSNRHFALAEQIWRRILTINGSDNEAISALQNTAVMKAVQHSDVLIKPAQQSESISSRNTKFNPLDLHSRNLRKIICLLKKVLITLDCAIILEKVTGIRLIERLQM